MNKPIEHWQNWIPILEREYALEIERAPQPCSEHANDHILRVFRRCITIGKQLNADLEILVAAAYLHDLGMHYAPARVHGCLSAEKAEPVLKKINFPEKKETLCCSLSERTMPVLVQRIGKPLKQRFFLMLIRLTLLEQ